MIHLLTAAEFSVSFPTTGWLSLSAKCCSNVSWGYWLALSAGAISWHYWLALSAGAFGWRYWLALLAGAIGCHYMLGAMYAADAMGWWLCCGLVQ